MLIERVVEGGDKNTVDDNCDSMGKNCLLRWVNIIYNGDPKLNKLWHNGDIYKSDTGGVPYGAEKDGIFISIGPPCATACPENVIVNVMYASTAGQPDVGINSWLEPPGNTYETTDIWIDSPVNGYEHIANPCGPI